MNDRADIRLVVPALVAWLVTAVGMRWQVGGSLATGFLVVAVVAAMVRALSPTEREQARVLAAVVLAAGLVGCGFGVAIGLRADAVRAHPIAQSVGRVAVVTVVPSESAVSLGSSRLLIKADLRAVDGAESRGRVVIFAPVPGFEETVAGRPMRFSARISRPSRHDLTVATLNATGPPDLGEASVVQRAAAEVRHRFAAVARDALPPTQAAMLPALVLGDTSALAPLTAQRFRAAGLTHLTAVSGANVTIVCAAVLLAGSLLGPRVAVGLAAVALLGFVLVVQPTASVLRAAVMGSITLLAMVTARRRQAIPALAASVLVLMIAAPQLAVDVGFALSVSATAALIVLAPMWSQKLVGRGWPKPLADALCIAVAAQLVTAPLVVGISGRLSLVGVLANLLVAPVIAPITVFGTAAAALTPLWPGAAELLIRFTGPELWWLLGVANTAGAVPQASVSVPAGAGGVVLMTCASIGVGLLWRARWFRIVAAAAGLGGIAWMVSAWA